MRTINHRPSTIAGPAAFTLIELLTVILIIMILAGLVAGIARYAMIQAHVNRAKAEIAMVEMALSNFQIDSGRFPPGNGGSLSSANILTNLAWGTKKYMSFRKDQTNTVSSTPVLVDPFGQPYRYQYPGVTNTTGFDLWSVGADGSNSSPDDITNWSK